MTRAKLRYGLLHTHLRKSDLMWEHLNQDDPVGLFLDMITFWFPYFALKAILRLFNNIEKRNVIWNKFPFNKLRSLMLLPDHDILIYHLKDRKEVMIILRDIYHLKVYDRLFKPEKGFTVVDVGSNIGIYTLKASEKVGKDGLVVSIEPENANYNLLIKNININRCRNVIPLKIALANFEGISKLYMNMSGNGRHSLIIQTKNEIDVSVVTLTTLLNRFNINKIDLMKLDVEGAELEVLKGSKEALKSKKILKMVIAAYHTPTQVYEIQQYLKTYGYKVTVESVIDKKTESKYIYSYLNNLKK